MNEIKDLNILENEKPFKTLLIFSVLIISIPWKSAISKLSKFDKADVVHYLVLNFLIKLHIYLIKVV